MLAAERKTELGMARAVGMRRSQLIGAFATEGWLYALVAAVLGVAVGVGLGRVLVAVSARIFSTEHSRFDLYFTLVPASLALAFAIGFVVALVTIVGTSLRVSRLNIIRAIRDIPEPPPRRRGRRLVLAGIAAAAGVAAHGARAVLAGRLRAPARPDARVRRLGAVRRPPPRCAGREHAGGRARRRLGGSLFALVPRRDEGRRDDALRHPGGRADRGRR